MNTIKRSITSIILMFAMVLTTCVAVPAIYVRAAEDTEYIHILYKNTSGDLKIIWKYEVTPNQETEVSADLMKDYDKTGVLGSIDDVKNITGIIVLKYRSDRDGDKAPSDLNAFFNKLTKEDTFQTGKPFGKDNIWTFDDPSGEMDWGGTLRILAETAYVTKITIKNAPKTIKAGESVTLKAAVKPTFASTKTVKWSVSNKKYAKISKKGKLTALSAGKGKTINVTATATDGSKVKATIKIKIK